MTVAHPLCRNALVIADAVEFLLRNAGAILGAMLFVLAVDALSRPVASEYWNSNGIHFVRKLRKRLLLRKMMKTLLTERK